MHSLRGRLFGTLLAIFICAWAAFGLYVCMQFRQARIGVMDHGLDELANTVLLSMPSDIAQLSGGSNLRLKQGEPARVENLARNVQVWNKARHDLLLRSASAISAPLKADFADGFANVQIAGEEWRVYAISDSRNEVQVQVGKRTSELRDDLKMWLYYAIGASFLGVLFVGIALKLVVRWSLTPVVTIQSAITKRDALDLTPLPSAGLPCEVRPLVDSFNRQLERLEHALQGERRFLTEAAHELRSAACRIAHARAGGATGTDAGRSAPCIGSARAWRRAQHTPLTAASGFRTPRTSGGRAIVDRAGRHRGRRDARIRNDGRPEAPVNHARRRAGRHPGQRRRAGHPRQESVGQRLALRRARLPSCCPLCAGRKHGTAGSTRRWAGRRRGRS